MTGIQFHVNVPDKLAYACRLLRKAVKSGARVVVTGEPQLLRTLDTQLWTFAALEFVPHCHAATADAQVLAASPVVLADAVGGTPHHEVLVHLGGPGAGAPDGFERFERMIEVVSAEPADLADGRRRWRHYADRGYELKKFDRAQQEA